MSSPVRSIISNLSRNSGLSSSENSSTTTTSSTLDSGIELLSLHHVKARKFGLEPGARGIEAQFRVAAVGKRKAYRNRILLGIAVTLWVGTLASLIWLSLCLTLISRLKPHVPATGVQKIVAKWQEPSVAGSYSPAWREGFTRDILPVSCHSHNDYWRRVPLYDAIAAGCTGVEADIWLPSNGGTNQSLQVGHTRRALKSTRTLASLYIDPLVSILDHQNNMTPGAGIPGRKVGVFDSNISTTLVLLLDFKSDGQQLWPIVHEALEPLREQGYLSSWDAGSKATIFRPITVVATGNAPFDRVVANTTYRDIFFDAPLSELSDPKYTSENSYYASANFDQAIGKTHLGRLSLLQRAKVDDQVDAAARKGLKSRYWNTPNWPAVSRIRIWSALVGSGVGMLNADNLVEVSRWNWGWCVVAGLVLCG